MVRHVKTRDVVLTKKVWECTPKIAILKQLQTRFKGKRGKGVGTPFPHVPGPLYPFLELMAFCSIMLIVFAVSPSVFI